MDYLESIAARYEGEAKVQRLQWIASRAATATITAGGSSTTTAGGDAAAASSNGASAVSAAAYRMLAGHFQRTGNTTRYKELFVHLNNLASGSTSGTTNNNIGATATVAGSSSGIGVGPAGGEGGGVGGSAASSSATNRLPIAIDATWLASQEMRNRQAREALASRLSQAQAHLHKDAIRAAYLALAEHEMVRGGGGGGGSGGSGGAGAGAIPMTGSGDVGGTRFVSGAVDLSEAFHHTLRAKDYCVTRSQTAAVSLQILELALALSNYVCVREYVVKLEHTIDSNSGGGVGGASGSLAPGAAGNAARQQSTASASSSSSASGNAAASIGPEVAHRVKIASALEALHNGDYARSATVLMLMTTGRKPGSSSSVHGDGGGGNGNGAHEASGSTASWPSVLCGEEIALYTGVLALSSLSRQDVLVLAEHAEALELSPSVREALWQFHRGSYQASWGLLNWPQLALDPHLGRHISALQRRVVERAVLAYWNPYLRVDLATMARDLEGLVPSPDVLLQRMTDAVAHSHKFKASSTATATKLTDTRIDLPNRVLVRDVVDDEAEEERSARSKLDDLTTSVLDDSYSMVVRLACLENNLVVRSGAASTKAVSSSSISPDRVGRGGTSYHRYRGNRMGGTGRAAAAAARARSRRTSPRPHGTTGRPLTDDDDDDGESSSDDEEDVAAAVEGEPRTEQVFDVDAAMDHLEDHGMIDVTDDMNPEDLY